LPEKDDNIVLGFSELQLRLHRCGAKFSMNYLS